ncbi:hypothetical protein MMC28_001787 [Mycoblastus sanguinarius]|nr:hypothetical protein [Mycoblastus sanguinarius]
MAIEATPSQVNALAITERVTSIFSLLGVFFIISTFLLGRGFNKPINRLIFFASWSNLGMNVAALIAEEGIAAGKNSSLCQFQGFAIQWFLGVDALWALCMGFNVYLALFRGWTAQRMRAQEWKYFFGCYGCSFIPALVYLFASTKRQGKIYGPALLWCWVGPQWDFLRIATLYGIVWVAIVFAFLIYCKAGIKVWRNRHELRGLFNPFNENPFGIIRTTTEINITSHPQEDAESPVVTPGSPAVTPGSPVVEVGSPESVTPSRFDRYTVNVEACPKTRRPSAPARIRNLTRDAALNETNSDAWLYARVAFLFYCALLLSWVPSSINRLYSVAHPDRLNFGLNYTEALVLPLQGFWNVIVYIITSQRACRNLWRSFICREEIPQQNITLADDVPLKNTSRSGTDSGSKFGSGVRGGGKGEWLPAKLELFTIRRSSQKIEDCEVTSVTSLRGH